MRPTRPRSTSAVTSCNPSAPLLCDYHRLKLASATGKNRANYGIDIKRRDGVTVASTKGPIDETAREPFRELLHPLVGQKGSRLVVDLSGSPRINSAGLGNLVA